MPHDRGLHRGRQRNAPNLFAWGSPQWITRMIRKPAAPRPLRGFGASFDREAGSHLWRLEQGFRMPGAYMHAARHALMCAE